LCGTGRRFGTVCVMCIGVSFVWNKKTFRHCLCDVYRSEFCVKQEDVSALNVLKCAIVYCIGEVGQMRRV